MRLTEQQHGAVTVVRIHGPVVESDAAAVAERLGTMANECLGRLVLDVSEVPFVDSEGLEAVADLSDRLAEAGQTLRLCGVTETLREVLELTQVAAMVEQFGEVTDAVRSFL